MAFGKKKNAIIILLLFLAFYKSYSQTDVKNIKKVSDKFYLMYIDSSDIKKHLSKSAIIEFDKFIVISELPLAYSNTNLSDHIIGGENAIATLKDYFPNKPIKYIISSHWHPHSISSIEPFLSKGITLITTNTNFDVLQSFLDSTIANKYKSYIKIMNEDSLIIKDESNQLKLYKVNSSEYSYLPTEEFIYTYVPSIEFLQTSCMYQRFANSKIRGKELISGRVEDLNSFITKHHLKVSKLLCTENFFDGKDGLISNDSLKSIMNSGIGMLQLERELLDNDADFIYTNFDSLGRDFIERPIPQTVFIRAIITLLKQHKLKNLLAISKLLAFINPSDPGSLDALAEAYYLIGEKTIAKNYEKHCLRIDPNFKGGGEEVWESDRIKYGIDEK